MNEENKTNPTNNQDVKKALEKISRLEGVEINEEQVVTFVSSWEKKFGQIDLGATKSKKIPKPAKEGEPPSLEENSNVSGFSELFIKLDINNLENVAGALGVEKEDLSVEAMDFIKTKKQVLSLLMILFIDDKKDSDFQPIEKLSKETGGNLKGATELLSALLTEKFNSENISSVILDYMQIPDDSFGNENLQMVLKSIFSKIEDNNDYESAVATAILALHSEAKKNQEKTMEANLEKMMVQLTTLIINPPNEALNLIVRIVKELS